MRTKFWKRKRYCYIRISSDKIPNIPILLPLFSILECLDAIHDSCELFQLFFPALRKKERDSKAAAFFLAIQYCKELFSELEKSEQKDIVDIAAAKENVRIKIRLL